MTPEQLATERAASLRRQRVEYERLVAPIRPSIQEENRKFVRRNSGKGMMVRTCTTCGRPFGQRRQQGRPWTKCAKHRKHRRRNR